MSPYQTEQIETLTEVYQHLSRLHPAEKDKLLGECRDYLRFRSRVDLFLSEHFQETCTRKCYENQLSACCSYEGIVTFFADVVVNVLLSENREIEFLLSVLKGSGKKHKCIYLGDKGCLWRVKPIVCEMFLCDAAKDRVFSDQPAIREAWEELKRQRKQFTWPDRPVLFDALEQYFMTLGCRSSLMYLNNSPGLLRVKRNAGLPIR